MMGLFVVILLLVWIFVAVWLGRLLSRTVFAHFTATDKSGVKSGFITFLLIAAVFLLPVLDQVIAYPKWQQLCSTTGDFEWGPGMDGKKVFGRNLIESYSKYETTIFPNIHVTYSSNYFKDVNTGELVLSMPHSNYFAQGMLYMPSSSGDDKAILLSQCFTSSNDKQVLDYLNQFNLKVVGFNSN